jgi:ABC-type branched-subunit amino acid transport system substrate-binding protein
MGTNTSVLEMMNDITKACFAAEASNPNTFRQNLQTLYTERLISLFKSAAYDAQAQAAALAQLKQILNISKTGSSDEAKAHYANLKLKIDQALALK